MGWQIGGRRLAAWRGPLISAAFCLLAVSLPKYGHAAGSGYVGLRSSVASSMATSATISDAKLQNGADAASLMFDVSAPVAASAFVLATPDRAIIDLPEVEFALSSEAGTLGKGHHVKKGLISSFRFGLLTPGRSRIVVDLARPGKVVVATKTVAGRTTLRIDLARIDAASFATAAEKGRSASLVVPSDVPPVIRAAPTRPTIVVDAGHGGPDTGAMVNGVIEKDVTLAFARMLADRLEATGGFNVVLTRSTDVFVALSERVRIARAANAALMISIHADTLPETADVSGATVYTVSDKASDAYAAKVAAKENDADATVGMDGQADKADVGDILFDLTRQETRAYSHVFSRTLVNYWKVVGHLNKNPQRSAGFVVLKAPDVPSVLLELGYLSNPGDATDLTSEAWRVRATSQMADAIVAYFADQHGQQKAAAGVPLPFPAAAGRITQAHAD